MPDITSNNAVQIQGWAVDDAFDFEDVSPTETMMGVDGVLSGGYVIVARPMTVTLQADSDSNGFFEAWDSGQQALRIAAPAEGQLIQTSIQKAATLITGFLTRTHPFADAKRVLQPRKFQITWQRIIATPIGIAG
jgi:hypothetical protein